MTTCGGHVLMLGLNETLDQLAVATVGIVVVMWVFKHWIN